MHACMTVLKWECGKTFSCGVWHSAQIMVAKFLLINNNSDKIKYPYYTGQRNSDSIDPLP